MHSLCSCTPSSCALPPVVHFLQLCTSSSCALPPVVHFLQLCTSSGPTSSSPGHRSRVKSTSDPYLSSSNPYLSSSEARSSSTSTPLDLDIVPLEYRDFADVFSKAKASELPPHCDYNLKINLEEGTSPPLGTLCSLSPVELSALWTFIDENLNTGFICPTTSSHAALVLFVKKKDGSLHLCIDF